MGAVSPAVIIVLGNEKGGAGKTTVAANLAIGIARDGLSVTTVDLDWHEQALTRWRERRVRVSEEGMAPLVIPGHEIIQPAAFDSVSLNEERDYRALAELMQHLDRTSDAIVIDTAPGANYLSRLAHQLADIVITPVEDSVIDHDMLMAGHHDGGDGQHSYRAMIEEARRAREKSNDNGIDWIVLRNRRRDDNPRLNPTTGRSLEMMARDIGFRVVEGSRERHLYRDLFAEGRTVFDAARAQMVDTHHGIASQRIAAREEMTALMTALYLPFRPEDTPLFPDDMGDAAHTA